MCENDPTMNRRAFLAVTGAGVTRMVKAQSSTVPEVIRNLRPMTDGIRPITLEERRARIEKARRLMRENKIGAVVMEGGSSMFYFSGARWNAGENLFAFVLPASGEPVWIVPTADQGRAHEAIHIGTDIRTWTETDGPY